MDIVFIEINQEAHLVKYLRYEAPNNFMPPWFSLPPIIITGYKIPFDTGFEIFKFGNQLKRLLAR